MRVLIPGGRGQLGAELAGVLRGTGAEVSALARVECDITDPGSVGAAFAAVRPNVVINCAAWTRVDAAESHPGAAHRVNAEGPRLLAARCNQYGALLVQISTDFVFGGAAGHPIDEQAEPAPASVYGITKREGELAAMTADRHLILRTAWLYGQKGPNFVLTILERATAGVPLSVVDDQRGTPTWTGHLAPAVGILLQRDIQGVMHLTNSGETTWYDFAEAILAEGGVGGDLQRTSAAEYGGAAPRPAYSVLDNRRWRDLGEPALPGWRDGLRAYLATRTAPIGA